MLVFYMQALLLASFHVHPQLPQNESARTYTEYALPGTAHSVNACMDLHKSLLQDSSPASRGGPLPLNSAFNK